MGPVVLRFHLVPPEHRVVVTPTDVKAATGKYLVRVLGGSTHAAVSDGARGPPPPSAPRRSITTVQSLRPSSHAAETQAEEAQ